MNKKKEIRIALASDHTALSLKIDLINFLSDKGYDTFDFGTNSSDSVDYTDYVYPATKSVSLRENDFAIVMCGTGLGASYVANKIKGIRAALCQDEFSARLSREHNDANVLVMGAWIIPSKRACFLADLWLNTKFEGERHFQRLEKIREIEKKESQVIDNKE